IYRMPRPVGSKNQKTLDWESFGKELFEGGLPRLQRILQTCDDDDFVRIFIPLLEFFKLKLKRVETTGYGSNGKKIIEVFLDDKPVTY
ncbi:MAG: hypothetical protein ACKOKF_05795, partial [Bacteroidota bacterium]